MNALIVLAVICMIATVGALGWGLISMANGGAYDETHSTELMFARVKWQGIAVLLLVGAYLLS